jgi:hypothetical protein
VSVCPDRRTPTCAYLISLIDMDRRTGGPKSPCPAVQAQLTIELKSLREKELT